MRVGIFGGSFNPVHNGHLKLAKEAMAELNLARIYFVPSYRTPLKRNDALGPVGVRLRALRSALKPCRRFTVSLCEVKRRGLSYTVQTLRGFKKRLGRRTALYFLAGAVVLKNLNRWRSLPTILKLCRFVVFTRPGYALKKIPRGVLCLPLDALDVSSSQLRRRLKRGLEVSRWLPAGVERLLRQGARTS